MFKNIRIYILLIAAVFASGVYFWVRATISLPISQYILLDQIYALSAVTTLYLTLIVSPLVKLFPDLAIKEEIMFLRRPLGVSAFLFALLHSLFAFFGELGGFVGLPFLDNTYIVAIVLSSLALLILLLLTLASIDYLAKFIFRWKFVGKLIYLAGVLIVVHALLLGTHFSNLSQTIPQIFFLALLVLLILEGIRLDEFITKQFSLKGRFGPFYLLLVFLLGAGTYYIFIPEQSGGGGNVFNIHSAHIQLAQQAQQTSVFNPTNNPALIGDRSLRYTVSFSHPDNVLPNQDTPLDFQVYNASSGSEVDLFNFVYSKVMHLVIVDDALSYYNHIHPTQVGSHFQISTQFPHNGIYHLYLDFQPLGAIEQQIALTLNVGLVPPTKAIQIPDTNLTKTFGNYIVSLSYPTPLRASLLSVGQQQLSFKILDKNSQSVVTLKPYLAAFGHLVMINEDSYDYIHVHPTNIIPPQPDSNGGPDVNFLPLGLYGPIKPGIYRVFAQFNPDNNLFVADFTIKLEP